jgi:c(7)-type cytochrome triheme protein
MEEAGATRGQDITVDGAVKMQDEAFTATIKLRLTGHYCPKDQQKETEEVKNARLQKKRMDTGEVVKRVLVLMIAVCFVTVFAGSALAVPSGKTLEWPTTAGKVIFDGKVHAEKGLKCSDCHTKIFKMKKGADEMTMAEINKGKFCGECHNGEKAFKTDDASNCSRCHKK